MGRKSVVLLPEIQETLQQMGEQIRAARLRRRLSIRVVAARAGVSQSTVCNVEKGDPAVAIGIYAAVLHSLNDRSKDLLLVAKDAEFKAKLDEIGIITPKRAPRRPKD